MKIETVVSRTITAYQCDGPDCASVCETEASLPRTVCDWVEVLDQSQQLDRAEWNDVCSRDHLYHRWQERARRSFCSWLCVANWAYAQARSGASVVSWLPPPR